MPDRHGGPARRHRPPPARAVRESKYEPVHLPDDVVKELHTTARPGKGEILVKVFADATSAFAAGDLPEAIRLGEQSKHIALRSAVVRELLGLAYYQAGDFKNAAKELGTFRRISGSIEQNPVIADCYRAGGRPERALELCDEMEPGRVDAAVYYEGQIVAAGALNDMGRIDEAIARLEGLDLRPAVAESHHARVWYMLADLLEQRGRFSQASSWFEAVVAADPDGTDAAERLEKLRRRR